MKKSKCSFMKTSVCTQPITSAADTSEYGIGAVISHTMNNGTKRPVAFTSRTLILSEKNYSQVEKEALSLVFGVSKFHAYLYGHQFMLLTDHKPLTTILGAKKGTPTITAARLQRCTPTIIQMSTDCHAFRCITFHQSAMFQHLQSSICNKFTVFW